MSLRLLLAALVLAAGAGCSDDPKHAPLIDPCDGNNCPVLGGLGTGSPGTGSGTGGAGNGTGGSGGIAGNLGNFTGTVVDLVDDTFRTSIADTQPAIVEAQGSSVALVSAEWNGIDPFALSGVQTALDVAWLSVRPKNGNASIRTLTPVSPGLVSNVVLPLIQTDVIDAIFQGLSTAATRTAGTGQLVVSFVSKQTGTGVPGVKVTASSSALVAYRTGGAWSTDSTQTDSSGLVLVGNVPAAAFPGTGVTLTLSGVIRSALSFAVASDAVSLGEARLVL